MIIVIIGVESQRRIQYVYEVESFLDLGPWRVGLL